MKDTSGGFIGRARGGLIETGGGLIGTGMGDGAKIGAAELQGTGDI